MTIRDITSRMTCPAHATVLTVPAAMADAGVPWPSGELTCARGCRFPVIEGIPRFTERDHYANAFGLQWQRYQKTQLDSHTGAPISKERLERCLGGPLSMLAGKTVLECGAGAGRFTEHLVAHAGTLVSLDLSSAVDANVKNCTGAGQRPYLLVQADMNKSPLPRQAFDVVLCLGVLQHTPSPEQSMTSLAEHVKPGGILVVDHYASRPGIGSLGQYLSVGFPLREVLKRLDPETGLKATRAISAVCDPIRKRTSKFPLLDLAVSRVLPTASYYGAFPALSDDAIREWNELDTHDGLTDWYKHRRSPAQIEDHLRSLGLWPEMCARGGNGVEARARRPA